ncbi:MAG: 4-(cytidine 5'-diphospho)-2-C-methyl-D-erythritol kinase [Gammaproteobacteria bacterium]|nr:4-(cytidine 5'-diphospho)-2-C-methyl-D-erythritol kinase [Gammaproteobacteria bacterium]
MESWRTTLTSSAKGWPAPAKLNLYLRVVGRRDDGYHLLSTAFQFLDFGDRLHFAPRTDSKIALLTPTPGVSPGEDLIVRAARALNAATGTRHGVDVRCEKRIPPGGGLGGGSSDAATTLVALNRLWGIGLSTDRLATIALELGADVPVFVRGRAAHAAGVGEQLEPMDFPEPLYVVIHPGVQVDTGAIFAAPELTRDSRPATISNSPLRGARNDCESVVRARSPEVSRALSWLRARGPGLLTGTGSCVFSWRDSQAEAGALAEQVAAPWRAVVARGCNRSPLCTRLDEDMEIGA